MTEGDPTSDGPAGPTSPTGPTGPTGHTSPTATAATALPASIEYAWGLRGRPGKGPRPGLSLDRIVEAAITVAGRDGLDAVSMSRVAAELGSAAMSLYRYIASKDELLALMVDTAMGEPAPGPTAEQGWRAGLAHWARSAFDAYRRRRWIVRVPITAPPITPNQIVWMEAGLVCLRDTGLTEPEKLSTILLVSGYVRSQAVMEVDFAEAVLAGADPVELAATYGRTLSRLIDPERFPAVHAAIASGSLDDEPDHAQADFTADELAFGLERILDGLEVLISSRSM